MSNVGRQIPLNSVESCRVPNVAFVFQGLGLGWRTGVRVQISVLRLRDIMRLPETVPPDRDALRDMRRELRRHGHDRHDPTLDLAVVDTP